MSQFVEGPVKGFVPGAAIKKFARVKLSGGKVIEAVAGVTDELLEIGTAEEQAFGDADPATIPVRLRNAEGTRKMIAAGAFAQGAGLFGQAAGKVDDVASGAAVAIAMEAATADLDIVEVMYIR